MQQAEAISTAAEHLRRSRPRTMGSLFWQLNDCWPAPSKSSLDYYGRWKALHYAARRFYADLLISPYRHDALIDVYLVSDKLGPVAASVRTRLLTFDGKTLSDTTADVTVPPAASTRIATLDQKASSQWRRSAGVVCRFRSVGGREGGLPEPGLLRRGAEPAPARGQDRVHGEGRQSDARFAHASPQCLCVRGRFGQLLRPATGEPVTIELPASADAVRVISLTDALSPHYPPWRHASACRCGLQPTVRLYRAATIGSGHQGAALWSGRREVRRAPAPRPERK